MATRHKLYGLIGKKLGHSFSRGFFNKKFSEEAIDAEYLNFEIDTINRLPDIISSNPYLSGLNVTIPYKEEVLHYLDHIDPLAEKIGAVNTIKIINTGSGSILHGYNTDITGFTESIRPRLKPSDRNALILGTGGAAKAIKTGLDRLGIRSSSVSRNKRSADMTYADLTDGIITEHTVIINATPLGMWPDTGSCPPIPYDAVGNCHVAFDAVYNPDPTLFLKKCKIRGATTVSGIGMLEEQAMEAWRIWNNEDHYGM